MDTTDRTAAHTDPSTGTRAAVRIAGLRCHYGSHEAVRGIDLDVRHGEVFALLGTNGAGKSTTLETLEGHRRPTSGTVEVLGADPHRARRVLAGRLGVMFQEPSTPDELTPAETVALWRRLGIRSTVPPGGAAEPAETLERVGLGHRRDVPASQLSGGERRRLDLAVALATGPELLLLDEPTAGLDPESRVRTWELIRDAVAGGVTVLLTTHYLEEAEALADRLAIMHEGAIALTGSLGEVLDSRPARIRFRLPATHVDAPLPPLTGSAERRAPRVTVHTTALQHDLGTLLRWAEHEHIELGRLQASEPTLAEVFHGISSATDTRGGRR